MQRVGELDRVVDAAVQAQAPDRIVDVGRVAREEHSALAEGFRHALVHAIDVPVRDELHRMIHVQFPQPPEYRALGNCTWIIRWSSSRTGTSIACTSAWRNPSARAECSSRATRPTSTIRSGAWA